MSIIAWIVFGALVGWIASILVGTDSSQGGIANIFVGIVGAFIGGFIMSLIGKSGVTGFNLYSAVVSIIGAVVLLWLYRMIVRL